MQKRLKWLLAIVILLGVTYMSILLSIISQDHPLANTLKYVPNFFNISVLNLRSDACPHGGSWGDAESTLYPALLVHGCSNSTTLCMFNQSNIVKNISFPYTVYGSCWGDVNKDGWDDVLLLGRGPDNIYFNYPSHFQNELYFHSVKPALGDGASCIFNDMNNDGFIDIVRLSTSGALSLIVQKPKKGFEDATNLTNLPSIVKSIVGISYFGLKPTLIMLSTGNIMQFYDISSFPFKNITRNFRGLPKKPVTKVAVRDMNNDGLLDFILLYSDSPARIFYNAGNSSFHLGHKLPQLVNPESFEAIDLAIADFNNDMRPDIFVLNTNLTGLVYTAYINEGTSFAVFKGVISSARGYSTVKAADYDFDGNVDLAVMSSNTYLFHNSFNATKDANWIVIELFSAERGTMSGSTVIVEADGISQTQSVLGSHSRLHFGIGKATIVTQITVKWNFWETNVNKFYGFEANQIVTILTHIAFSGHHQLEVLSKRIPKLQCPEGSHRLKPSFFIIGVWKAGTSSLAYTLAQHPQVHESARKELYFFNTYYPTLSFDWYLSQFPCTNFSNHISFEATAGYLFARTAPAAMFEYFPEEKFIVMLRDPVERMYSHFHMIKRVNRLPINQDFDEYVHLCVDKFYECLYANACLPNSTDEYCAFEIAGYCSMKYNALTAGLYFFEMTRWYQFFSKDQFFFIHYPDFIGNNYAQVLSNIESFLDIEQIPIEPHAMNISPKREPMLESTKLFLQQFYAPFNSMLFTLLGRDFGWNA